MDKISVVVPLYNEQDNVAACYQEISQVLREMRCKYEIIFIDDGSRDETISRLIAAMQGDANVKIIEFRRNFGQTAAMAAGFDHTSYDSVVAMDGDLQNDPREIPKMVAKLKEGYD